MDDDVENYVRALAGDRLVAPPANPTVGPRDVQTLLQSLAPNIYGLASGAEPPPISMEPSAGGKVPSADDPRYMGAVREMAAAAPNFLPLGGAELKGGALAASLLGMGARDVVKGAERAGIKAYHGSPYDFDRFDMSKIGTGEGAQIYGHGLYFAEAEPTALSYKNAMRVTDMDWPISGTDLTVPAWVARSSRTPTGLEEVRNNFLGRLNESKQEHAAGDWNAATRIYHQQRIVDALDAIKRGAELKQPGHMYEVNINAHPDQFLDWDKPLAQQGQVMSAVEKVSPGIINSEEARMRDALATLKQRYPDSDPMGQQAAIARELERFGGGNGFTGQNVLRRLQATAPNRGGGEYVSASLRDAGIPGIKYLDQGSRGTVDYTNRLIPDVQRRITYANEIGASTAAKQKLAEELAGYQDKLKSGTSNYVLFRDDLIDILRKYGIAGMAAPAAASAATSAATSAVSNNKSE